MEQQSLRKEMGVLHVFCVSSGAMISSGLFVLPGLAFALIGPGVFMAYLGASLLLFPSLLCHTELATAIPRSGGSYMFIDRSIGPAFGMMGGLANWASLSFKTAFALIGMGAFAKMVVPGLGEGEIKLVALGACFVFTIINLMGARHAARSQVFFVLALLVLLAAYIGFGAEKVRAARYTPLFRGGAESFFACAAMVFVSFGGLTKVASVAEEVRNPGRNLPLGMFFSYGIVSLLYVGVVFVTVGIVDPDILEGSLTPISRGGETIWPRGGAVAMGVAAMLAFLSTANAGILSASRTLLAMGRDDLLPKAMADVHPKRGVPQLAILATGCFIAAVLFIELELFVKTASAMVILLYGFSILSVILMRESQMPGYQPSFRSPGYPWLHFAGLGVNILLLIELGTGPILLMALLMGAGLVWYGLYARKRVQRESALVRVAKRIALMTFGDHDLDHELAGIVHENDPLYEFTPRPKPSEDRFDRLVREGAVLDIEGPASRSEFLGRIADALAPRLGMPGDRLAALLSQREESSSTVVAPGLCIPHVVVEGERRFEVLLARCRQGADFGEDQAPVHAAFVLVGSHDERNFHLRALMAVAEIAQSPNFQEKWRAAPDAEALKQIVLRTERRREPETPGGE